MIRRWSIGFALFSAIFWFAVMEVSDVVRGVSTMAYQKPPSMWTSWLIEGVPATLYAAVCVLFCHRFASRLLRLARQSASKD